MSGLVSATTRGSHSFFLRGMPLTPKRSYASLPVRLAKKSGFGCGRPDERSDKDLIAIYARQSVDKKDSVSIEGQIELCKRECGEKSIVFQDKGYSGKNTDRPAFQKMMRAVKHDEISKIVVYRLDRISRSITDFGMIWQILNEHRAEFVSVNEKFDTGTPVGRAMVYIIMVFAQLERETIAERIKDNYHQRAKRGAYLGGPAPFGFKIQRTEIGGKRASMLVPTDEIEIVKAIFHRYAYSGESLGKIAAWLAKEDRPGISRRTWDNVSVSRILHNPSYVRADADIYDFYKRHGAIPYNDVSEYTGRRALWLFGKRGGGAAKYTDLTNQLAALAHHDGVVDSQTFLLCQNKMARNKQIKNAGSGKYSWLSGLVKCGYCGYAMRVVHARGGYVYFVCSGKTNLHLCTARHEHPQAADIEAAVEPMIAERIGKLRAAVPPGEAAFEKQNAVKIERVKIEEQISHLMDALAEANDVAAGYINERLTALDTRKQELLGKIGAARPAASSRPPERAFSELDLMGKKSVAQSLIDRVLLTNEKVDIHWKY